MTNPLSAEQNVPGGTPAPGTVSGSTCGETTGVRSSKERLKRAWQWVADMRQQYPDGPKSTINRVILALAEEVERLQGLPHETSAWRSIETAPHGLKVMVGYKNRLGKWRTVMACYYEKGTLEAHHEIDPDFADEDGYALPGWYEECETSETIQQTDEPPTHWHPLPGSPLKASEWCHGGYKVVATNVCTMFPHCLCSPEARAVAASDRARTAEKTKPAHEREPPHCSTCACPTAGSSEGQLCRHCHRPIRSCVCVTQSVADRLTGIDFLQAWMRAPNPMLGNVTPLAMLRANRGHKVAQFIEDTYEGDHEDVPAVPTDAGFKGSYLTGRAEHICGHCGTTWRTERGELDAGCPKCGPVPRTPCLCENMKINEPSGIPCHLCGRLL